MTDHTYGPTTHGREIAVSDDNGFLAPITFVISGPGLHVQDYLMPEQARDLGNALLALALKHDPDDSQDAIDHHRDTRLHVAGVEQDNPADWPTP